MAFVQKRSLSFDLSRNLYIDESDLENLRFICQGSFGHVWQCTCKNYPKTVALKRVSLPIEEEGMILQSLSHPKIIKYLGVIHNPPNYGLVMEFAENGSLGDYLHRPDAQISTNEQDSFIQQISADESDLENLRFIGQGSFGHVWQCTCKNYPKTVALKRVSLPIEEEGMILQSLSHPNIIKYLGVIHNPPNYGLVMEFAENGSLGDYLHRPDAQISTNEQDSFIQQISAGMLYLHHGANFPIMHRDLKPQNILLSNNFTLAKIADFGCAKLIVDGTITGSNRGSIAYMAPELIREEGKLSRAADVYSFGVVLWEILTKKRPFSGKNEAQIIYFKGVGNSLPTKDENLREPYKEVIEKCFEKERRRRPDFKYLHAVVTHSLGSSSTNSSSFSFGSDRMPDISAGGDNSHLAWISYPREVVPEAEWSPQEKESLAVRKNRNTVMVLNTAFFNVDPPRMDEVNKTPPPPDLGPELEHRERVTCFGWGNGGGSPLLAVGTADGRVWLWTGSGTLLRRIIVRNNQPVLKLEWNSDSSLIGVICQSPPTHSNESSSRMEVPGSDGGVEVLVVSLETEFHVTSILNFSSFSDVLTWSKVKQDMLVCCEMSKVHIFKNDDYTLSAPKSHHQSRIQSAVWSPLANYVALVSKTALQIFSVENTSTHSSEDPNSGEGSPSKMKVRSKTSMQKIGDIQGVVWHPKNADEIFVNNFAEVLVINVAKKTHRKIFVADDESSLSFFSLSPNGQAAAIFADEQHALIIVRTDDRAVQGSNPALSKDSKNIIGKVSLIKKDILKSNPIWNSDGSRLCLSVEYAKSDLNMFDYSLLLVNLESKFNIHCLVLERPKSVKTFIEVSR